MSKKSGPDLNSNLPDKMSQDFLDIKYTVYSVNTVCPRSLDLIFIVTQSKQSLRIDKKKSIRYFGYTAVCPKSLNPFYIVGYYVNWVKDIQYDKKTMV